MAENLPELAVDDDFSSEAFQPDEDGIYKEVEYRRKDNTLYMKSTLSERVAPRTYSLVTLTYYDLTGKIPLHAIRWRLVYDINNKIITKRID